MDEITPYATLVRIARSLVGTEIFDALEDRSAADAREYLSANAAALAAARAAIDSDCRVPLRYEPS
jgi:hypothetical protein